MDLHARDQVILANLNLARKIAWRYYKSVRPRNLTYEDLQQVAMLTLVKCAEKYDPAKLAKFSSYAGTAMSREIQKELDARYLLSQVGRRRRQQACGVAKGTRVSKKMLDEIANFATPEMVDVTEAYWVADDPDDRAEMLEHLRGMMGRLDPGDADLLTDKYVHELTIAQLAKKHGINRESMRLRVRKALAALKALMA